MEAPLTQVNFTIIRVISLNIGVDIASSHSVWSSHRKLTSFVRNDVSYIDIYCLRLFEDTLRLIVTNERRLFIFAWIQVNINIYILILFFVFLLHDKWESCSFMKLWPYINFTSKFFNYLLWNCQSKPDSFFVNSSSLFIIDISKDLEKLGLIFLRDSKSIIFDFDVNFVPLRRCKLSNLGLDRDVAIIACEFEGIGD